MKAALELIENLSSKELRNCFISICSSLPKLTSEDKVILSTYLESKISLISSSVKDIILKGDEEEFSGLLVNLWLENRLEWNRYNCQMQYQARINEKADSLLMARGSCISMIIDIIEQRLSSQDLFWVVKIAVNPIEAVSYRMQQNKKLVEKTSNYGKISNRIINTQLEMLEQLSKSKASNKIIQKFKSSINLNVNSIASAGFLEINDLSDCVENILVKKMKDHELQFNVKHESFSTPLGIPPEVVEGIQFILSDYLDNLLSQSIESKIGQRVGKSDFVNFYWEIEYRNELFYFHFKDDGLGCNDWSLKQDRYHDLELDAVVVNSIKNGSKLKLGLRFLNVSEYLLFESNGVKFAINSSRVVKVIEDEIIETDQGIDVIKLNIFKENPEFEHNTNIVFKDEDNKLWTLAVSNIAGLVLSRQISTSLKDCDQKIFNGHIESNGELVKIINSSEVDQDSYEKSTILKILL